MGWFMQKHDIYVGGILEELNLRFAPGQGAGLFGGVDEMTALQKEFKIFKVGRSFRASAAVLNLGARNNEAKNGWLEYLGSLHQHPSNKGAANGDAAIVQALKKNLASKAPLPVHFTSHDLQQNDAVQITEKARPIHYLEQDYLLISLPMQSVQAARASMRGKAKARSTAKKAAKSAS
ncbi:hypothetical protein [Variovorax sp. OV329]|uniref:hypothetical protein n=1 Tax=Variovorax sp. OV329 TaxID=1882825 RepID=UPI0008E2C32D|nr:hypothetical protein [Variovorax sp. OV329]SFM87718.1 hypothetical protein SAMN05444747_110100 [Variovorax sp. OV329]